jgi:hypothetical protein
MAYDNPHGLIATAIVVQTLALDVVILQVVSHRVKDLKFSTSELRHRHSGCPIDRFSTQSPPAARQACCKMSRATSFLFIIFANLLAIGIAEQGS